MNFLESHRLVPCVVGLAISAALLWLAAEIFAVSRTRMRPTALRLKACAVLLGGFGLWWPGHFLAPLDSGSVLGIPFLAGGLAWGLAGLALSRPCRAIPDADDSADASVASYCRRYV